jgi:SH3-like domain-containing protein
MRTLTLLIALLFSASAFARGTAELPYYASIKSDKANIRTGPSVRYPIDWIYMRPNWPVQVTATFETWRKIKDINGDIGWIHESLLSGRRYGVVKTNGVQEIYRLPITTSTVTLIAEDGVVAEILSCKSNWCKVKIDDEKGWIDSKHLWGIREDEVYN